MTVTLNSGWELVTLSEAVEGRKIGRGNSDDLRTLNRAAIHEFASDVATALAVLNVPVGINAYTTSYAVLARGKVRVWGNGDRITLHMYGNQTRVRLTLGGVVVGTAAVTGTSNAWGSMSAVTLSGATRDADGMVTLLIEVQRTTGSPTGTPTVFHVLVSEDKLTSGVLPAAGNTETNFLAMHDELYATADGPVDTFALQALDDNAELAVFERPRRCCHLFPMLGAYHQFHRLSSCHWRLDGPYVIQVPPYMSEGLTVTVTVEVGTSGLDLEVFALSEYEDFEAARIARAVSVAYGAVTYITFKNIQARAGEPCLVWIAFRSEVDGGTATNPLAYHWSGATPQTILCERDAILEGAAGSPGGVPWGYCIVAKSEDVAASKDPTIKNALGFSTASQMMDIAAVQGLDNSSGGSTSPALMITISPHPGTGITRAPDLVPRTQYWTGSASNTSWQPELDVREMAIGFLYGVYIQCGPVTAPDRRKYAGAGTPPAASIAASIAARINQMVIHGTAQCLLRHSGAANILPTNTLGGSQVISYGGDYLFSEGSGVGSSPYVWTVPLAPPNVSGGLASLTLYGQFILMCCMGNGEGFPDQSEAIYECRWATGSWVVGSVSLARRPSSGAQQSPTEADALAAMTSVSNEVGASPQQSTSNAYGQCVTWPSEGSFKRGVWALGPVFKDVSQPSFPAILQAEIKALGGAAYAASTQIIVAGLHVWWGPREQ